MLEKLKKLAEFDKAAFFEVVGFAIENSEKQLVKTQRNQWVEKINNEGETIGLYKKTTEILSKGRKKAGTPYTLYDSGSLYKGLRGFTIENGKDVLYEITSIAQTLEPLEITIEVYGLVDPSSIFGFTDENKEKMAKLVSQEFIKIMKNELQL